MAEELAAVTVELLDGLLLAFLKANVRKEDRHRLPERPVRVPRPWDRRVKPTAADKVRALKRMLKG